MAIPFQSESQKIEFRNLQSYFIATHGESIQVQRVTVQYIRQQRLDMCFGKRLSRRKRQVCLFMTRPDHAEKGTFLYPHRFSIPDQTGVRRGTTQKINRLTQVHRAIRSKNAS